MAGVFDAVSNVFDTILGGGPELPAPPAMPTIDTTATDTLLAQLTASQEQLAKSQADFATFAADSAQRQDELAKQTADAMKPKAMPTSADARAAAKNSIRRQMARRGRSSTILTDAGSDSLG